MALHAHLTRKTTCELGSYTHTPASPIKGTPKLWQPFYTFNVCAFHLALVPAKVFFLGPRAFLRKTQMRLDRRAGRRESGREAVQARHASLPTDCSLVCYG